ncbi:MAG: TetR/AcrR family transcriptional regulator [Pikeienuella sp.]
MAAVGVQSGLRERQKAERRTLLLSVARRLFETIGYDATTMAAVAAGAGVSTPTVFNYFGSKDDLMLAIIWEGHRKSGEDIALQRIEKGVPLANALTDFFETIAKNSMAIAGKRVWRFAEATNIRRPKSEFVKKYSYVDDRLAKQLTAFLVRSDRTEHLKGVCEPDMLARVLYNHWNALFMAFIRDEEMTMAEHVASIRKDMKVLVDLIF